MPYANHKGRSYYQTGSIEYQEYRFLYLTGNKIFRNFDELYREADPDMIPKEDLVFTFRFCHYDTAETIEWYEMEEKDFNYNVFSNSILGIKPFVGCPIRPVISK